MDKTKALLLFLSGAAIGSAATWYFTKKKYEAIANEEINSVKEVFARKYSSEPPCDCEAEKQEATIIDLQDLADKAKDKPDIIDYASKVKDLGYTNDQFEENSETDLETAKEIAEVREDLDKRNPDPYVINPDQFGEREEYEVISIFYYADKILADDNDELIEDVDGLVGSDSLLTFGQYDDDAVFVRNERLQTDFEILRSEKKYLEVLQEKPYLAED